MKRRKIKTTYMGTQNAENILVSHSVAITRAWYKSLQREKIVPQKISNYHRVAKSFLAWCLAEANSERY